ncbi:MAG: hypothetical protein WC412_02065 [Candidatus Omnitrophota bacterium]
MIKTKLPLICLLSVLISSGCITGHKRHKDYVFPGKYKNKIIAENRFEVSFIANKSIDEQKAKFFALLKCATITLENGYKYLLVSEQTTERKFFSSRPTVILKIVCFIDMPQITEEDIYNAEQLKAYIEARYNIKDSRDISHRTVK